MTESQEEKRGRHPTYITRAICQHAHYHHQMFQMCLWVRKRLGVPVLAVFPSVRYLSINNCCWLTTRDLSACALVIYLLRASSPSTLHNGKSLKKFQLFNLTAELPSFAQKCTLCFCGAFLQKIPKDLESHPIPKITRDLSCRLAAVYWRTSVWVLRPALQRKLTRKLDLWSWFFSSLLFQLVTASFHSSQSTFRTAFEAAGSNVKSDAESTGSAHGREVKRRSILLHSCPDPSDRGQAAGHKRQQGF